ncbi:MAG: FkbM family methyltransferase [Candidatus Aenigmarchaeota archaeon]|nr:FkbM family methyltransferase [Candidatus Aenigmarchaeota archaeon]
MERIKRIIKSIFVFKNWPLYFTEKFSKNSYSIFDTRKGVKIKTRRETADKGIILEIFFDKTYNPNDFEIKDGDTVIDIGGHIGVFSLYASTFTRNKIICFEPIKENFNLLNENIRINNKKNIKAYNLAVCNQKKLKIFLNENNTGGHSYFDKTEKYEIVNCITLEEIFKNENIERCNFLKIDCEGCEHNIILNTPYYIFDKIDKICIEYHDFKNYKKEIINFLRRMSFNIKTKGILIYANKSK